MSLAPLVTLLALLGASLQLGGAADDAWATWFHLDGGEALTAVVDLRESLSLPLDNGMIADVRVTEVESSEPGRFQGDDFTLTISSGETRLAVVPMWASYGRFALAAVDLVGGPGDELLIVSLHGRGSPVFEPHLQIWAFDQARPRQLLELQVGSFVSTCALWREQIFVAGATKPRSLRLIRQVESSEDCPEEPGVAEAREILERELTFAAAVERFVLVERK